MVTVGCFGVDNCIKFEIVASLGPEEEQPPSGWRFAQLEVGLGLSVKMMIMNMIFMTIIFFILI